jgi:hypothetical protein
MAYDQAQQDKLKEIQLMLETNVSNLKNIKDNYREEILYTQNYHALKRLLNDYQKILYNVKYTII